MLCTSALSFLRSESISFKLALADTSGIPSFLERRNFEAFFALMRGERMALKSHIEHCASSVSTIRSPNSRFGLAQIPELSQRSANL